MRAWQATVQDEAGNAVFNPHVTVYQEDGETLADIFNEDGSVKENPFIGTTEGFAQFWAERGTYKVVGANGGVSETWQVDLADKAALELANDAVEAAARVESTNRNWSDLSSQPLWAGGRSVPDATLIGAETARNLVTDDPSVRGVVAMGAGALDAAETGHDLIAIGKGTMSQAQPGRHNIAIGGHALNNVTEGNGNDGSRNIGLGSLSGFFLTTGQRNVLGGRDAGHNITTGSYNTAWGYMALFAGKSPIGWSGEIELMWGGKDSNNSTAVGTNCLKYANGSWNTGVGADCMPNLKRGGGNVAAGVEAGYRVDSNVSWLGKDAVFDQAIAATYSTNGTTVAVTLSSVPAIGIVAGDTLGISFTSGPLQVEMGKVIVAGVSGTTITFADPVGNAGSGSASLWSVEKQTDRSGEESRGNVLVGRVAAQMRQQLVENVAIGDAAFAGASDRPEISVGNTLVGVRAGRDHIQLTDCSALGRNSLRYMIDGSTDATINGSTAVGVGARVSGDNQVQIGGTGTTPYAYAALQVRSDERDKADIAPTQLGLDFIERIEPVQYRWDMRDDYVLDVPEKDRAEWWSNPVKDGSKKRARLHQGVIAQQVRQVCEDMGVDFSGLQDHSHNGGNDVLTVGYEHFVPVLIRAVQQISERLRALEGDV